jgi:hypothetical protein
MLFMMVPHLSLKNIILALSFFVILSLPGQDTISLSTSSIAIKNITSLKSDRQGNIYTTLANNQIQKFNPDLKKEEVFSPSVPGKIHLHTPAFSIVQSVFYQDVQTIVLLDRFLVEKSRIETEEIDLGFVSTSSISTDNNLWLLDESEFKLCKYNLNFQRLDHCNELNLIIRDTTHHFTEIIEYQNRVYLFDQTTGVYIFDNLGTFIRFWPLTNYSDFCFYKDHLWVLQGQIIDKINLYTSSSQSSYFVSPEIQFLTITSTGIYLASENQIWNTAIQDVSNK